MIKLKGNTPEEKFTHIERILNRMSRKLHKTVIGIVPPVPIMMSVEVPVSNVLFNALIPAKGVITDVCLLVRYYTEKTGVVFEAGIAGQKLSSSVKFTTRSIVTVKTINLEVSAGDILTFKTESPEQIRGIWLSFLYQIGSNKADHIPYLIDELNTIIEEENPDGE